MEALLSHAIPVWALLAYMVFMCAIQTMPRPEANAKPGYVWAYRFLHLLCCNLSLFMDPMKKLQAEQPEQVAK